MHPSPTTSSPFIFLFFSLQSGEVNRCLPAFPPSSPTPPRWSKLTSPVWESPGATSFTTLQTPCHLTCHTSWWQGKQQHATRQPPPRANGGEEEGVAGASRCTTSCSPKAFFLHWEVWKEAFTSLSQHRYHSSCQWLQAYHISLAISVRCQTCSAKQSSLLPSAKVNVACGY